MVARAARSVAARGGPWHAVPTDAIVFGTLSVVGFVLLWQVASTFWVVSMLFPPPLKTLATWWEMVQDGSILYHVRVSLVRIAVGFAIGTVVGVPVGLAMGLFTPVLVALEPYVQFLRFVPPIAWLIPAILWFGIGEISKTFLIVYTTIFLVLVNTMAGVRTIPRNQIRAARTFGLSRWQMFAWVTLPAIMPRIFTGMRIAMGNSFAAVVGAELIAAEAGLGYLITESATWMASDRMFSGMLTLGLLGILADVSFRAGIRRYAARYFMTQ